MVCLAGRSHHGTARSLFENHIFLGGQQVLPQKDGMTVGSSLSPIVSNILMEHFEKLALDSAVAPVC
jgi:hypothetical protein